MIADGRMVGPLDPDGVDIERAFFALVHDGDGDGTGEPPWSTLSPWSPQGALVPGAVVDRCAAGRRGDRSGSGDGVAALAAAMPQIAGEARARRPPPVTGPRCWRWPPRSPPPRACWRSVSASAGSSGGNSPTAPSPDCSACRSAGARSPRRSCSSTWRGRLRSPWRRCCCCSLVGVAHRSGRTRRGGDRGAGAAVRPGCADGADRCPGRVGGVPRPRACCPESPSRSASWSSRRCRSSPTSRPGCRSSRRRSGRSSDADAQSTSRSRWCRSCRWCSVPRPSW